MGFKATESIFKMLSTLTNRTKLKATSATTSPSMTKQMTLCTIWITIMCPLAKTKLVKLRIEIPGMTNRSVMKTPRIERGIGLIETSLPREANRRSRNSKWMRCESSPGKSTTTARKLAGMKKTRSSCTTSMAKHLRSTSRWANPSTNSSHICKSATSTSKTE